MPTRPPESQPRRVPVVLDLGAGELVVSGATVRLARDPTADEVLTAYLSLVYRLRQARPGVPIVLREIDLAVLARGLDLARPEVDRRLQTLMVEERGGADPRGRSLRGRVIAGAVLAIVAVVAVLVGLRALGSDDPVPAAPGTSSPSAPSSSAPTVPPASLIPSENVSKDAGERPAG